MSLAIPPWGCIYVSLDILLVVSVVVAFTLYYLTHNMTIYGASIAFTQRALMLRFLHLSPDDCLVWYASNKIFHLSDTDDYLDP
jgi:hypothetical protein